MALTVNGVEIKEARVQDEMARLRPEYETYVRANGGEPSEAQLREWAQEDVIEEALFRQEAIATQPVPSDERARQYMDSQAEFFNTFPQEERLARSKEVLQQRRLMKVIRKGVRQPGEAEIKAYYDAHAEVLRVPETLLLSHICRFVEPGNKADTFLELLRIKAEIDGSRLDWAEALETFSDSFSRDYGYFDPVSRGEKPPEIEKKLFALKPGEVSDVLDLGVRSLHLFKLQAIEAPRKMELKDIKERLSDILFEEACQAALEVRMDTLKAAAIIQREA